MKKCYFYESWYLVAGLLVVLEVLNVQLLSELLPQPIPALISALLAAVLFMYLGQAFKSYREAVRDDMETWKKEQARLTDTVALLKRDIDSTKDLLNTSIFYVNNKLSEDFANTAKAIRGVVETNTKISADKQDAFRQTLASEVRYMTSSTVAGLQAKTEEIKELIHADQKKTAENMDALERAVGVIGPRLSADIAGITSSVSKEIASRMDLTALHNQIARETSALANIAKDNHISGLAIINACQENAAKAMDDNFKAVHAVMKDNHISALTAIASKSEDVLSSIAERSNTSQAIAKDNHLSTLSVINGTIQNVEKAVKDGLDKDAVAKMSAAVEGMAGVPAMVADEVRATLNKFMKAEEKSLKEISQTMGIQSFRTEAMLDNIQQLRQDAKNNSSAILSRCADLEVQLASVGGMTAVRTPAVQPAEIAEESHDVPDDIVEANRTESYKDPATGLTLNKYYVNNSLVSSEMTDGCNVKYDVSYNEAGEMISSRSYDREGKLVTELSYHKNGKVATRTEYIELNGSRTKQVTLFDENGKKLS